MKKQTIKKWVSFIMPSRKNSNDTQKQESYEIQKFYEKYPDDSSAEAQLINQLIHMNILIKMTRQVNYQEYILLNEINTMLCQEIINTEKTAKALMGGINIFDEYSQKRYISSQLPYQYYSVRALLWKINLGYLPKQYIRKWVSLMQKNYAEYNQLVKEMIVIKIQKKLGIITNNEKKQEHQEKQKQQKTKDHPLSFSGESKWKSYFQDVQLWNKIEKDIKRTRKQCKFFEEQYSLFQQGQINLRPTQVTFTEETEQTYSDALIRILFVYIKTHPQQTYTQGMNEIAALIFYCFTNKNSEYMRRVSQSDAYHIMKVILSKLPRKHFNKGEEYAKRFLEVVKKIDLRLYQQIQENGMLQGFKIISIRWFLVGFLNQFNLDDSLLIWDCIISWSQKLGIINIFMYLGLAIMHLNRNRIVQQKNILLIFNKIENSALQIVQKTKSLHKLFPKLFDS